MSRKKADLLVCYDIRDEARLRRVHRCICSWGIPLQYSVFYCKLDRKERRRLEYQLRDLIDNRADDVRVYDLRSVVPIEFMGKKPNAPGWLLLGSKSLDRFRND